ncbi:MAG: OmpH family outer membrane protein [Sphingobacteriaceae bacterium]
MKKSIKVAILAIGLSFAGSYVNAQQKFGHINSSDLLQSMPEMKTADANFQTFAKAKQSSLELMDGERQKKIAVYQEKYKTLSEANKETLGKELETLGKEIQDMEKRITETEQKSQEELNTKRSELYQPVFERAEKAVKQVAKEKGFSYVFDVSQPGVVFFEGGEDIIELVKAKLAATAPAPAPAAAAPATAAPATAKPAVKKK